MRKSRLISFVLIAGSVFVGSSSSRSADVTSRWLGGYGSWTEPTNWLYAPATPGADYPDDDALTYDVEILSGDVFVPVPTAPLVQKLTLGGGTLHHDYILTANDLVTWTNGNFTGSGTLNARNGMLIAGEDPKSSGVVVVNLHGLSLLTAPNGVNGWNWNNFGTFEVHCDGPMPGFFVNEGVFRKTNSFGTTFCAGSLMNRGRLEIESGSLCIDGGGTYTGPMHVNSNASLTLWGGLMSGAEITGRGLVRLTNGAVTITSNFFSSVDIELVGGAQVTVDGRWQVASNSTLRVKHGSLAGSGLRLPASSLLEVFASPFTSHSLPLTNEGTIRFVGSGGTIWGSGRIRNHGVVEFPDALTLSVGNGFIENQALMRKSGTTTVLFEGGHVDNRGTVHVEAGTLVLKSNGTNTGAFLTDAGATLFVGSLDSSVVGASFGEGALFSGEGRTIVTGDFRLRGNVTNQALMILEYPWGAIWGDGTLHVTSAGILDWRGGDVSGSAGLEIHPGALLLSTGNLPRERYDSTIRNRGSAVLAGTIYSGRGAFANEGLLVVSNDCSISLASPSAEPNPILSNAGTLLVTNATFRLPEVLTNHGVVTIQNATLRAPAVVNHGTLSLNGGLNGALTNSGRLEVGQSFGTANVTGLLWLAQSSVLNIDLGGAVAGTQLDQWRVHGSAVLNGALNVRLMNGFTPALGERFTVMSWTNVQGIFQRVHGLNVGNGLRLAPLIESNRLDLLVLNAPEQSAASLRAEIDPALGQLKIIWPATHFGFLLETSTNLNEDAWTPLRFTTDEPALFDLLQFPKLYVRLRDPECCD